VTSVGSGYWTQGRSAWALAATATIALLAVIAVIPLVTQVLSAEPSARIYAVRPVLWLVGIPEILLAAWIGLGMLAFGLLWRVPIMEGLTACAAVIAGFALGLLPLYVVHLRRPSAD
jgi:hypothetical protein